MTKKAKLHLFEAFGVELEYMIVSKQTLDVLPISDLLLTDEYGQIQGEWEHGDIAWSNELVGHVIEIKSNGPKPDLKALSDSFHENIKVINKRLSAHNAMLLSSAAHPWMNPNTETVLWAHDSHEIYQMYDSIFGCKGHGWSNLQSTHINLPFYDDEEFSKLHTAIRFLLPLIPSLTASSPILREKFTEYYDRRLYYYERNQSNIPVLTGRVIPERIYSKHGYQKYIYDKITEALRPHNSNGLLNPIWMNSRGAIARFDRGAVEIRIIDIQECAQSDLAVVAFLVEILKLLVGGNWISFEKQKSFSTDALQEIFHDTVRSGSKTKIESTTYRECFGVDEETGQASTIWREIYKTVTEKGTSEFEVWKPTIRRMIQSGTLAERIIAAVDDDYSHENILRIYRELSECLKNGELFRA
ncbi:MAG: glutamate-cysteine ligase family protein [Cyclobacteriaceae bacterium]